MWVSRTSTKQPQEWERATFDQVAQILVQNSGSSKNIEWQEGDTVIDFVASQKIPVVARYISGDHVQSNSKNDDGQESGKIPQRIILRPKQQDNQQESENAPSQTLVNPLWLFYTVNEPSFLSSWLANHDGFVRSSFSLSKILAKTGIAIPSRSQQDELAEMLSLSDMCLKQQAALFERKAELLREMNRSINHEILVGNLDRNKTIQWLKKSLVDRPESPLDHSQDPSTGPSVVSDHPASKSKPSL